MAETKYGQHIINGPFIDIKHYAGTSLLSHKGEFNADISIGYHCIADTDFKADMPHSHDFHELLIFIGGDPTNITDFNGEIEFVGFTGGKPVSDKVTPDSVEANWTNKRKDVNCIMCRRKMTVKRFEQAPYYCYRCEPEVEAVFLNLRDLRVGIRCENYRQYLESALDADFGVTFYRDSVVLIERERGDSGQLRILCKR